jgi:flagellar biogenesis protein FliO
MKAKHQQSLAIRAPVGRLSRSGHWLVVAALVACPIQSAAADDHEPYPPAQPPPAWSEPAPISNNPPAAAPQTAVETSPAAAPRLLPARFVSNETGSVASGGSAASAAPEAPQRPLRLSRQPAGSPVAHPSLLGGKDAVWNAAGSLGIVLALFLAVAWAMRRGAPKEYALLPTEAVEVLGRATLVGRAQVHLVRCGNKIVLVHVTAGGVETLTEISDPAEVDRLHSICHPAATSERGWRRWLGHFGASRPVDYLARDDSGQLDFRHLEMGGRSG